MLCVSRGVYGHEGRIDNFLPQVSRSGGRTHKSSNQVPGPSAKHTPPMDMAETLTPHRNPSGTTGVTPTSASV